MDNTNIIASKYLGKKYSESKNYSPELLVAIPRKLNREQYQIKENDLPFLGYDIWHCYEFSALTENNIPVSQILKSTPLYVAEKLSSDCLLL